MKEIFIGITDDEDESDEPEYMSPEWHKMEMIKVGGI